MFESGAVPSQDGAGGGSDGEGLAAAPHEEPESEQQLDPPLSPVTQPPLTPMGSISNERQRQQADKKTKTAPFTRSFVVERATM